MTASTTTPPRRPRIAIIPYRTATMAAPRYCPSCLSLAFVPLTLFRTAPRRPALLLLPPPQNQQPIQLRAASTNALKYRRKDPAAASRRKKARSTYLAPDLKNVVQFSLVDAMRYALSPDLALVLHLYFSLTHAANQIPPRLRSRPPTHLLQIRTPRPPPHRQKRRRSPQPPAPPPPRQNRPSDLRHRSIRLTSGPGGDSGRSGDRRRRRGLPGHQRRDDEIRQMSLPY